MSESEKDNHPSINMDIYGDLPLIQKNWIIEPSEHETETERNNWKKEKEQLHHEISMQKKKVSK
jgi:hypothetical protein